MNPLQNLKETMKGDFWLHAAAVLVGFKASDLISAAVVRNIKQIPAQVAPFVGPLVVVAVGPFLGKKFGSYVIVGAALHIADTLLGMIGVPQGQITQG